MLRLLNVRTPLLTASALAASLLWHGAAVAEAYGPPGISTGQLSPYAGATLFGTGSDGTVACSSGTTTLTQDMQYTNLTISGSCQIKLNGWHLYVSNLLDISQAPAGAIQASGTAGSNASGATGGGATTTPVVGELPWAFYTIGTGGTGNTTTGTNPTQSFAAVPYGVAGQGGAGGTGGTSTSAGASGLVGQTLNGAGYAPKGATPTFALAQPFPAGGFTYPVQITAGLYGGPGGQGGGDAINAGGGGGGPGMPGGFAFISARFINRGASTAVGAIQAKGAAGGNGAGGNAAGGGAGGAGSGGAVYLVFEALQGASASNALDASGGTGGTGGNGVGTGKGGAGGTGGGGGAVFLNNLSAGTYSATQSFSAGTAGSTTSTSTGAAGGAGVTVQVGL